MNAAGCHRILVTSSKSRVGKTVTAAALGYHLSEVRGEITVAIDANSPRGALRRRLVPAGVRAPASIVELAGYVLGGQAVAQWPWLARWHDLVGRLRLFSNAAATPAQVNTMTAAQYTAAVGLMSAAAQLVVQDVGTSHVGEVASAALACADTLVVVADRTQDTLKSTLEFVSALAGKPQSSDAALTFSELTDGRYARLVEAAVVVVNPPQDPKRSSEELKPHLERLLQACAAVVLVPADPHLARGEVINFALVDQATTLAHLQIVEHIARRFPLPPLSSSADTAES